MESIRVSKDNIAACGLYCGACRKFLSGKCPGCKNNEKASWCKIRQCCISKGYHTCAECERDVRECKIYSNFISKVFALLFNSDRPACISYIREHGEMAYAEEMSKRKCQTIKRNNMKINTFTVIMLALAILVGSCDSPSDNSLYREWRLQKYNCIATSSYGLTQVNKESEYILQLDNTGVFSCTTDCNTISGNFEKNKNALKFSDISFTELACDDMIVERSVAFILRNIKSYEITDDSILVLKDDKGHILMELTK